MLMFLLWGEGEYKGIHPVDHQVGGKPEKGSCFNLRIFLISNFLNSEIKNGFLFQVTGQLGDQLDECPCTDPPPRIKTSTFI